MIGNSDGHSVDVGLIEQVVIVGVGARDLVAVGCVLESFGVDFGNRYCRGARTMEEAIKLSETETAGSNHGTTKSFGHIVGELLVGCGLTCWDACRRFTRPGQSRNGF